MQAALEKRRQAQRLLEANKSVNVARRVALCRAHGVPTLFASLSEILERPRSPEIINASKMAIATSNYPEFNTKLNAFCTLEAQVFLAQHSGRTRMNKYVDPNGPEEQSQFYGELTGSQTYATWKITIEQIIQARYDIIKEIKSHPPTAAEFNEVVNHILRDCRAAIPTATVPHEIAVQVVPGLAPDAVMSGQTHRFYHKFGHIIPADIFPDKNDQARWRSLSDVSTSYVDIGEEIISVIDDKTLSERWVQFPEHTLIGYHDALGRIYKKKARELFVTAVVAYVLSSFKCDTVTDRWITRRLNMIMSVMRDVNLVGSVSPENLTFYAKCWAIHEYNADERYQRLAVVWSLMVSKRISLASIMRLVALASWSPLYYFAKFITGLAFFDVTYMISEGIRERQFAAVIEFAIAIIHNPYSNLDKPYFQRVRTYADLAYIGAYGCRNFMSHLMAEIPSVESNHCVKSTTQLGAIASNMFKLSSCRVPASESDQESPKSGALRKILKAIVDMSTPSTLEADSHVVPAIERTITPALVEAAALWGYAVPEDMQVPVPDVSYDLFVLSSRPSVNGEPSKASGNVEDPGNEGVGDDLLLGEINLGNMKLDDKANEEEA